MRLWLRFLLPLGVVLGLIAYAVVPFADQLMVQWFVRDLDLRSQLIAAAVDDSLFEVIDNDETRTQTKVQEFFNRVLRDERLFALGFCNTVQEIAYRSEKLPADVRCPTLIDGTRPSTTLTLPGGPVHMSYFPMHGSGDTLVGQLVLLHDMNFVQSRSTETQRYLLFFICAIGAAAALITVLIAQLSLRGWISGLHGLVRGEALFRRSAGERTPRQLQPLVRDLRELIRDLDTDRKLRDDDQTSWSPRTLKELLEKELAGDEVIVVSNREPYIHTHEGDEIKVKTPASGVVTALEPIMQACSGTWIAHGSGDADKETVDKHDRVAVPPDRPKYQLRRVWLTPEEEEGYYYGFANAGLWPLCHIAHVRPAFKSSDWEEYKKVNRKFAEAVVQEAKTDNPVILVQDYHYAMLPLYIREKLPKATIVTFWHIPWPNPETFGICPWTEEILEGLLGSSIVGFHTRYHSNNFIDTVERFLESRVDREHSTVSYGGKLTGVQRYPISIEFPGRHLRQARPVEEVKKAIREQYGLTPDHRLAVGVDRMDYTKGLIEKFAAVERLLELYPEWIGKFTLLQIAAPTRSRIDQYHLFHEDVIRSTERINHRFGTATWKPIILRAEHCEQMEILDHYRAADVCMVASLHDGMNLVSKEFVAARDDEQGVLVLSQFTGVAREFPEALIVNPYHSDRFAEALQTALTMPADEQRDRMRNMRGVLHDFNVFRWAGRMLLDAARMRQRSRFLQRATDSGILPRSRSV